MAEVSAGEEFEWVEEGGGEGVGVVEVGEDGGEGGDGGVVEAEGGGGEEVGEEDVGSGSHAFTPVWRRRGRRVRGW